MKENSRSDLRQPEMSTEYIEYLFSGKKPKKPIPKKRLLILGASVLVAAVLCLFLPSLLAGLFPHSWQARAEKAYAELVARDAYHVAYQQTLREAGKDPEISERYESWLYGNNSLNITHHSKDHRSYRLCMGSSLYKREVTPENPDAPWKYVTSIYGYDRVEYPKTLEASSYAFSKVQGGITGVQVTYTREDVEGVSLTFCFDLFGKLTGLTVSRESLELQQSAAVQYTIFDDTKEEIVEYISQCHQEAIKSKK
jgi:hypothetical protein